MFEAAAARSGQLEHLYQFLGTHRDSDTRKAYNDRFHSLIAGTKPGATVHWFNHQLESAMKVWAPQLKEMDCQQALHFFRPVPEGLADVLWGKSLLNAMRHMDVVFVETELYRDRLEGHFRALGFDCKPVVKVFDLALQTHNWNYDRTYSSPKVWLEMVRASTRLDPAQRVLIEQAIKSRDKVPHRFVAISSLDPGQGLHVVVDATRQLLENCNKNGATLEDITRNFRFFIIHEGAPPRGQALRDPRSKYAAYTAEKISGLTRDFPGVVFACEEFPQARDFYPAVADGCNGLSGGSQNSFDHHLLRVAALNQDVATSIVCGSGDGLAVRMRDHSNRRRSRSAHDGPVRHDSGRPKENLEAALARPVLLALWRTILCQTAQQGIGIRTCVAHCIFMLPWGMPRPAPD